jgi:hypothetical protein
MTTPTGKLAYGQPQNYDAVDDRSVIAAVTNGRVGLVRPVVVQAGTGLQVIIRANWVGVASCDDSTSAVVGSREDQIVQAIPGPATGSREDVVWCDTNPDEGTWELVVIPRNQSIGRAGIPLVWITVPANANLASQMTMRSVDASIERRALSVSYMPSSAGFNDYDATSWAAAVNRGVESQPVYVEPGQWYRVRYYAACPSVVGTLQSLEGRIGIGQRTEGQAAVLATLMRGAVICWVRLGVPVIAEIDYVFRHSLSDLAVWRVFDGRIWSNGPARIRPGGYTELGPYVQTLTVEDIGS